MRGRYRYHRRLEHGPVPGTKQDAALITKAPKLKKENGLIDWSRTAEQVCNQIRATQLWPTPYTCFCTPRGNSNT